jgi:hypothetical protein
MGCSVHSLVLLGVKVAEQHCPYVSMFGDHFESSKCSNYVVGGNYQSKNVAAAPFSRGCLKRREDN